MNCLLSVYEFKFDDVRNTLKVNVNNSLNIASRHVDVDTMVARVELVVQKLPGTKRCLINILHKFNPNNIVLRDGE